GDASLAIAEILSRCELSMPESQYEALIEARLGPSMKSITSFHYHGDEALAVLELPSCVTDTADDFILHPSLLNGAIQACNMLARIENPEGGPPTPFSLDELRIHRAIPAQAYAHVVKSTGPIHAPAGSRLSKYDLVLTDRNGAVVVTIKGYTAVSARKLVSSEAMLFAIPCWTGKEAVAPDSRAMEAPVFILMDEPANLRESLLKKWPDAQITAFNGADDVSAGFTHVFKMIQNRLHEKSKLKQPVIFLAAEGTDTGLAAACVGLFRTAHLEQARIEAKVIRYVVTLPMDELVSHLETELTQPAGDIEIRWREAGIREVRSIRETVLPLDSKAGEHEAGEVIWITGGLGGVGRGFARHYAVGRKARVFLSGRSSLDAEKQIFLQELQSQGAEVSYLQGDIANRDDVESMLKSILDATGRVNGIIHSAGVIEDAYIFDKHAESIERVWRPKVAGALALDVATRELDLDFMVFFSSLTGAFGNAGQFDYAGANAFLDHFAQERNRKVSIGQRRGRTVSVAWPLWREGGMRMDAQSEILLKQHSGMTPMETAQGVAAFHRAVHSDHGHLLVLHGDAGMIRAKLFPSREKTKPSLPQTMPNPAGLSLDEVQTELRRIIAGQQKIAPDKIELDGELTQYGFDSIRLTELANRLNKTFSLELMPTLFFEHTTLRAIARYLSEKHPGILAAPTSTATPPVNRKGSSRKRRMESPSLPPVSQPIAIVGVSGRFPGSANVEEFWQHLEANHDLICEVPEDRWSWREHFGDPTEQPGKTNVKCAGFMSGIDQFDPAFFGISPREAISMDPQFRLLLETVWETIEEAGYRSSDFSGTKTGVFIGI
ncbi:MAG: hypothetical protein RL693_2787, partial [Verrucomicrobiota bacterium]